MLVCGLGLEGERALACVGLSWAIESWPLVHMLVGCTAGLAAHRRCGCLAADLKQLSQLQAACTLTCTLTPHFA